MVILYVQDSTLYVQDNTLATLYVQDTIVYVQDGILAEMLYCTYKIAELLSCTLVLWLKIRSQVKTRAQIQDSRSTPV